jgi:hypothetical protein
MKRKILFTLFFTLQFHFLAIANDENAKLEKIDKILQTRISDTKWTLKHEFVDESGYFLYLNGKLDAFVEMENFINHIRFDIKD